MAIVHFPYGRTELTADLPDEDLAAVLTAQLPACGGSEEALVRRALDNPIGAPRLKSARCPHCVLPFRQFFDFPETVEQRARIV